MRHAWRRPGRPDWAHAAFVAGAVLAAALCGMGTTSGDPTDDRVLILAQPLARADAIWMAQARGFFKAEGLKVTARWVSAGRDALQALQATKDTPGIPSAFAVVREVLAMDFWQSTGGEFVVIAAVSRDADGYVGLAKADVVSPDALRAKTVVTQLGSTSAWFLHEYLRAHGLSESDLAVRHSDPGAIVDWDPVASDHAAYFVREPHGARAAEKLGDKVRRLTTARGFAHGYLLLGTLKRTLREHPGVAERLLRALDRGRQHADEHRDDVIAFAQGMFGAEAGIVTADHASAQRLIGFDAIAVDDFRRLALWMREAGLLVTPSDPADLFDLAPLRAVFPDRIAPDRREPPR